MTDPQFAAQVDAELQRVTTKIERLQSLKTKLQDLKNDLAQVVEEDEPTGSGAQAGSPADAAQPHVPQARRANASAAKAESEPAKPEPSKAESAKAEPTKPAAQPAKAKGKPKPAKARSATARAKAKAGAGAGSGSAKSTAAKRTTRATKKATKAAAPRARRQSRTDRIFHLLDEQPRSAAEVTKLLEETHPEQKGPENTVRTALNSLVGQDRAHLSRQGSAVFYSRPAANGVAESATPDAATPVASAEETVAARA